MKNIYLRFLPFSILVAVVVLDQLSKELVLASLQEFEVVPVIANFFNLTLHYNAGVAFGMFATWEEPLRTIVLTIAKLFALGLCLWLLRKQYKDSLVGQSALACIVGGALGNIIDRFRFGQVVDFLDVYFRDYHWPTFNIADSAICIGVALLLFIPESKNVEVSEAPVKADG